MINNAFDFKDMYNLEFRRKTLGTNLKISDDPIRSEFAKRYHQKIRSVLNNGVSYEVIIGPDNLDNFITPYYETMQRNKAEDDYYFSEEYFQNLVRFYKNQLIYVRANYQGKLIGACIDFVCDGLIQTHILGTIDEYKELAPSHILYYAIVMWGIENNCSLVHYGGGRTSSPDDGLYLFKKRFAQNTEFDYYVSEKI